MDKGEEADKVGGLPIVGKRRKKASDESTNSSLSAKSYPSSSSLTAATSISRSRKPNEEPENHGEPSLVEKKHYYDGLPSHPLLIARTGSTKWSLPKSIQEELPLKAMCNVGSSHCLVGIWESVLDEIVKALEPLAWTSIDLLRIGYQDTAEKDWPVTLMIGAKPGSHWKVTIPVAVACRMILRSHGAHEVECEVRESESFFSVADRLITANETIGRLEEERAFSECVAQCISPCAAPGREGTLGIYLAVGSTRTMCALTCRHVVFGVLEAESEMKKAVADDGIYRGIVQPSQCVFDKILADMTLDFEETGEKSDFLKKISDQQKMEDRRIGHVFFSPPRTIDVDKQLHDWLIVKLAAKRYASLSTLQNWIHVGRDGYRLMQRLLPSNVKPETNSSKDMVRLKGMVSKAEIFRTTAHNEPTQDHAALWVHMFGAHGSKLTTGISNEVRSVRRVNASIDSNEIITTREWCVVGRNGQRRNGAVLYGVNSISSPLRPFSEPGDSGSAMFDSQGRIAGILTSGCGAREDGRPGGTNNDFGCADVSYVRPIEVILDAIKTKYGRVEVL
ncbi:hypothetical protein CMQ_2211 [Grosmannia clavigera kw1407]|uniref:Uncharacterized protein n=1 Tax=Grosmannia clavigera (strain kw1407 / UAMH 11150) TaxID=655863 RepID=F0XJJ4_GROCL|nr:uncharacterized protein CMQ_2211 [Grosmannia clavigera kw1407]EFX02162.1 hypothetical protein CMQ_2211 [Grosmannia clavigera kw1407]